MSYPRFSEPLEPRRLMATVGPVVAQQFVGSADGVTAVVLTFDVPLDPTTANNPAAYRFIRKSNSDEDGSIFGGPFGGGNGGNDTDSSRIAILSATYDAAANQVTIIPKNVFLLRRNFTIIQVQGNGDNAVRTTSGENIDGDGNGRAGGDLNLRFRAVTKKTFSYREADGDRVKFKISGPGRIFYLFAKKGKSSPSMFLRDPEASTLLTSTVKAGRRGNGVVDIAQISDIGSAQVPALTDPALRIRPMPTT